MLGRRVALGVSIIVLAVSGGSALAATQGNSHSSNSSSSKPDVRPAAKPHAAAPHAVRGEHHCPFSGNANAADL